jgi:excisionase family DNA binding protein
MANSQQLDADLLTVAETARYLKVSEQTVRKLIKAGKLVGRKIGTGINSRLRISASSIERFMRS